MSEAQWRERMLTLALAQGLFYLAAGIWPLVGIRRFETVLGPKADRWLARTVAGLTIVAGTAQVRAARRAALTGDGAQDLGTARDLGIGTALTLTAIDLAYAGRGRVSRAYLLDIPMELAWLAAWSRTRRPLPRR